MKKIVLLATAAAAALASPASAAFIDFETNDTGGASVANTAIAASDYDALGATFTGAFYKQCGGGCPAPAGGHFVSSVDFQSPFTVSFAGTTNSFSFENVSFSGGLAEALDAGNAVLDSVNFAAFPGLFSLNGSGIASVRFSSGTQFGVDNFNFTLGAVPEPASWALMIAGFGLVGSAMRRRRETVRVSFG